MPGAEKLIADSSLYTQIAADHTGVEITIRTVPAETDATHYTLRRAVNRFILGWGAF